MDNVLRYSVFLKNDIISKLLTEYFFMRTKKDRRNPRSGPKIANTAA